MSEKGLLEHEAAVWQLLQFTYRRSQWVMSGCTNMGLAKMLSFEINPNATASGPKESDDSDEDHHLSSIAS
jgi:hypothetical protein